MNRQELLDKPAPHGHFVQLYTDDEVLARNVSQYLCEGLGKGEAGIVIATQEHREAFRRNIEFRGVDAVSAEREGKLLFLDAEDTLSRFVVAGRPDWDRFQTIISAAAGSLKPDAHKGVRAYGEMVGLLWTAGSYSAAIQLEDFWNRILQSLNACLYCAYPIDVFGSEFQASGVHAILCDHTHLLPGDEPQLLEKSLKCAIDEVSGGYMGPVDATGKTSCWPAEWGEIPSGERLILWIRTNLPNAAPEILRRAREAYEARSSSPIALPS